MAVDEMQVGGVGARVKRVEDDRFIRGKGNYTDDFKLPGMLHMEILRSPHAHARIVSIDTTKAWAIPGVHLVLTGELMAQRNLAWMPTLSYDTQAVLAMDKVRFQGQEVAAVVADDPYIAKDACEAIEVVYDPLPAIVNPTQAIDPSAPLIRDDKDGQSDNVCYRWEVGDKAATDRIFAGADKVVSLDCFYPRSHPSPIECCGSIADYNPATGKLTIYMTTQAPHIIRTAVALVAELPEHMIRIIAPDIGGGFGNKVPVYPGYVISTLASILVGRPVKWIEDKTGNLISTGFARDMYFHGELAIDRRGRIQALRVHVDTDNGAFFSDAQPTKFKVGLVHSAFACYDIPVGHLTAQGHYTNKAPGGVAYRCSFRVTEAMFFQERLIQAAATDIGMDQADFRRINFVTEFPARTTFGMLVDSGAFDKCLTLALEKLGYEQLLAEKAQALKEGRLIGIGISTMTEPLGAGNSREFDIIGIKMFDSAELRVHPSGKAVLKIGSKTQGQGHETTFAQIVTHELGIPSTDILVHHGDTDNTPFGMGTYASRSTPTAGAATSMVARKVRA
ncbi:MAG: molybdopterin cofactor-binding domain-containing protein, partial [Acidimicrobiia bacterium]